MVRSGVRMLIECRQPTFSTPDVFEIYSNFQTYPDPTGLLTTEFPSTTTIQTTSDPNTTVFETSGGASETTFSGTIGCHYNENDHGAIFDTGNPYIGNAR